MPAVESRMVEPDDGLFSEGSSPLQAGMGGNPGRQPADERPQRGALPEPRFAVLLGPLRLLLYVLITLAAVLVVSPWLSGARKLGATHLEAEAKHKLHTVQLAAERFAVDHDGSFPLYLIGGSPSYSDGLSSHDAAQAPQVIAQLSMASDPLLAEGYLNCYPNNPFLRSGGINCRRIGQWQENGADGGREDPLRNGSEAGRLLGTRFGPRCDLMGQVLADQRYGRSSGPGMGGDGGPGAGADGPTQTCADFGYPLWDLWQGRKPRTSMPGAFFYKSASPLRLPPREITAMGTPFEEPRAKWYMLGVYGASRSKGQDVLGEERPVEVPGGELWAKTSSGDSERAGSPYRPNDSPVLQEHLAWPVFFGNPNGIKDGIILVLNGGT